MPPGTTARRLAQMSNRAIAVIPHETMLAADSPLTAIGARVRGLAGRG